jgi:hypothetical protein
VPRIAHGQGAPRRAVVAGGTTGGAVRRLPVLAHRSPHPGRHLTLRRRADAAVAATAGPDPGALPDAVEPMAGAPRGQCRFRFAADRHRRRPGTIAALARGPARSSVSSMSPSPRSGTGTEAGASSTCGEPTAPSQKEELRYLGSLAPSVVPGLRSALARTFVDAHEQLLPVGPAGGWCIDRPTCRSGRRPGGCRRGACLTAEPARRADDPIPAAAYNVAASPGGQSSTAYRSRAVVPRPPRRQPLGHGEEADRMGPAVDGRAARRRRVDRAQYAGRTHRPVRTGVHGLSGS